MEMCIDLTGEVVIIKEVYDLSGYSGEYQRVGY